MDNFFTLQAVPSTFFQQQGVAEASQAERNKGQAPEMVEKDDDDYVNDINDYDSTYI